MKIASSILVSVLFLSGAVSAQQPVSEKGMRSEVKEHQKKKKPKKPERAAKVKPLTPAEQKEMDQLRNSADVPAEPGDATAAPK